MKYVSQGLHEYLWWPSALVRARFDAVLALLLHSDKSGIVDSGFGKTTSIFPLGRAVVAPRGLWVLPTITNTIVHWTIPEIVTRMNDGRVRIRLQ
jgi:hypothetical protein